MFGEAYILEPDVALTDYLLAAQCFGFAWVIYRKSPRSLWLLLFGSLGVASLSAGTVHGFLSDETTFVYALLWRLSLLSIGAATLAAWYVGTIFLQTARLANWMRRLAVLQFVLYAVFVLFYSDGFLFAALNYLPAAIFLLFIFTQRYLQTKRRAFLWGAVSIALTFAGSFVQIANIPLHPQYFNHNALYHAIQFVAFCFLFACARNSIGKNSYAE